MNQPNERLPIIDLLREVEQWGIEDKVKFFEKIIESVPIGMRMIIGRDEITAEQKVEALRLMNEFHREMNQTKKFLTLTVGYKFEIYQIYEYLRFVANREHRLISSELAFCIYDAFGMMKSLAIHKNKNYRLQPSIYKLLENEEFEKQAKKIIGEENLNNLEGFILGYFYAIDTNEINMHGTRGYPDLRKIEDWILLEKEVAAKDWKSVLNMNSQYAALREFLKRYRNNIVKIA